LLVLIPVVRGDVVRHERRRGAIDRSAGEPVEERVRERHLLPAPRDARPLVLRVRVEEAASARARLLVQPGEELDLAELDRLEAARRDEGVAECEEVRRRHRLEDAELLDEHALDLDHAPEVIADARDVLLRHRGLALLRAGPPEHVARALELRDREAEPQLRRLVDHDEEELVVVQEGSSRVLERQELGEPQVRSVVRKIALHPRTSFAAVAIISASTS
jgi:hypothetical protein